jgi:TonB family protein
MAWHRAIRKVAAAGGGLLLIAGGGMANAAPATVTEVDWLERPTSDAFAENYPKGAQLLELPGYAMISCVVTAQGRPNSCKVVTESPAALGFGHAAIRMSSSFKMRPKTVDGVAVEDSAVRIPVRFLLPEPPLQTEPRNALTAETDAAAKAVVAALEASESLEAQLEKFTTTHLAKGADEISEPTRRDILAAFQTVGPAYAPRIRHAVTAILAERFTAKELHALTLMQNSPFTAAIQRPGRLEGVSTRASERAFPAIVRVIHDAFC